MPKRRLFLGAAVIILAAGIGSYTMQTSKVESPETTKVENRETAKPAQDIGVTTGKMLPEITLNTVDGQSVKVGRAGQITVLNFWATWCPPCRQEMPELNNFSQQYGNTVVFYAINIQEPAEKVASFMHENNYIMPTLLDKDGEGARTFRVSAIPTTLVVDKNGIIKYRKAGPVTMAELEGVIKEL